MTHSGDACAFWSLKWAALTCGAAFGTRRRRRAAASAPAPRAAEGVARVDVDGDLDLLEARGARRGARRGAVVPRRFRRLARGHDLRPCQRRRLIEAAASWVLEVVAAVVRLHVGKRAVGRAQRLPARLAHRGGVVRQSGRSSALEDARCRR